VFRLSEAVWPRRSARTAFLRDAYAPIAAPPIPGSWRRDLGIVISGPDGIRVSTWVGCGGQYVWDVQSAAAGYPSATGHIVRMRFHEF